MAEGLKSTEEILAAPDAFRAAHARATAAFMKVDGVVNVGYGLKQTGGEFGKVFAIVVFVREKKPAAALTPAERIPPAFEEYPTDVRVVPHLRPGTCDNTVHYTTIQGGIQIANAGGDSTYAMGTIGCMARRRNDSGRDNIYLLSNAHVIYADGHGVNDGIFHPAPGGEYLGPIQDGGAFRAVPWTPGAPTPAVDVFIDCAMARFDIDSVCCGSTCTRDKYGYSESIIDLIDLTPPGSGSVTDQNTNNRITDVRNVIGDLGFAAGEVVWKVGRTTERTKGTCVSVTTMFVLPDPFTAGNPPVNCVNCIEIIPEPRGTLNCKGHAYFAEEGDSGSLVVDDSQRAVGLLFAVPNPHKVPPDPPNQPAGACHIVPILDHLGICIPCKPGATGHGSATANDGSGRAPIPLPAAQSALPVGQIVFTADGAAPGALPAPVAVSELEVRRMRAHLESFRRTRIGPPLHAIFGEFRREIGYLVRNVRPVKVAWARHQGPAWLAHILNHISGHTASIPHEVKGVTRRALLAKMRVLLAGHGSNPLRRALDRYGDEVLEMLTFAGCDSVADCIAWIRQRERESGRATAARGAGVELEVEEIS